MITPAAADPDDGGLPPALTPFVAGHRALRRHAETLAQLAAAWRAPGAGASPPPAIADLLRYFEGLGGGEHADQERWLHPALIEAMAGSDPVCLRELGASLTAEHREIESRWRALRPRLNHGGSPGAANTAAAAEAAALASLCEAHARRELQEWLPMAARLLDDAALAALDRVLRDR